MKYIRITEGLSDKGQLVPLDELENEFTAPTDFYASHYYYNEKHVEQFQQNGTVSGIKDVVTDKVIFDFDSKDDLEKARKDAVELVSRLQKIKISEKDDIQISFSGYKGFTVLFKLDRLITPEEHAHFALNFMGIDLETLDQGIYNASRLIRLPNTKHPVSGLYKIGINLSDLKGSLDAIKEKAKKPGIVPKILSPITIDPSFFKSEEAVKKSKVKQEISGLEMKDRPKHWKDYKWALYNAVGLKAGERKRSMMVIGSTCRALNYPETIAESFLKGFDQNYANATEQDTKDSDVSDVLKSVYSENWQGGQYSIKNNPWLQDYVNRIGLKPDIEEDFISITDVKENFSDFSENFEKNLVKTGIPELDDRLSFLTSTHNGLLGQPGSGKTSFALQWLRNMSDLGSPSVFYSLDMAQPIVYGKLVQQEMQLGFKEAMREYKSNRIRANLTDTVIANRYKNVSFNFRSGVTVEQMKEDVKRWEDMRGEKVRLLVVDYLECLQGPYSDQTANTGYISNQMKDLANELGVCSVMLLQTQKHSTSEVSDPLTSMKQIKGSSVIEQASSLVLTLWREGYHPDTQSEDKYISFACVKNRFGPLWRDDFKWDGGKGLIEELTDEDRDALAKLRADKIKRRLAENDKDQWK